MSLKHTKGFIDPITLGFVVALAGAAMAVTFEQSAREASAASQVESPAAANEPLVANQVR